MTKHFESIFNVLWIATLITDIKVAKSISHNWFEAQRHCLGKGITIEKFESDVPYWTGKNYRLTPWIKILGCFHLPYNFYSGPGFVSKNITTASVGRCQEICQYENLYTFALQMNNCICMKKGIEMNPLYNVQPPAECNHRCEDYPYKECGGENTYNIFEVSLVKLNSEGTCLSLQCSRDDVRFVSQESGTLLEELCQTGKPNDFQTYASRWNYSMEHCKNSQLSYLMGNVNLTNADYVCNQLLLAGDIYWIGVARQLYTNHDQGMSIMWSKNTCRYQNCLDLATGPIICQSTENQSPFTNETLHNSSDNEGIVLKNALPVVTGVVLVCVSVLAVLHYIRKKNKKSKTGDIANQTELSSPNNNVYLAISCITPNSYSMLQTKPQNNPKASKSLYENPYNNSEVM